MPPRYASRHFDGPLGTIAESLPRLREVPGGWRENPTRAV
jgi:hypothetical protein